MEDGQRTRESPICFPIPYDLISCGLRLFTLAPPNRNGKHPSRDRSQGHFIQIRPERRQEFLGELSGLAFFLFPHLLFFV